MRGTLLAAALAGGFTTLGAGAASAMPVAPISNGVATPEKVALVCDDWGRCWRTRPRYYRYRHGPPYRYGHYGPGRGYYRGYDGPRYHGGYYGGPGVSFHFGF